MDEMNNPQVPATDAPMGDAPVEETTVAPEVAPEVTEGDVVA